MGFEVIVRAYGGKVLYRPRIIEGFKNSFITDQRPKKMGHKVINQLESHFWYVPEVPEKQFDVLAQSDSGIEIVSISSASCLGTQFHPEEGGTRRTQRPHQDLCLLASDKCHKKWYNLRVKFYCIVNTGWSNSEDRTTLKLLQEACEKKVLILY
jgi:GMP synthase-like glutamine amidotransferase